MSPKATKMKWAKGIFRILQLLLFDLSQQPGGLGCSLTCRMDTVRDDPELVLNTSNSRHLMLKYRFHQRCAAIAGSSQQIEQ